MKDEIVYFISMSLCRIHFLQCLLDIKTILEIQIVFSRFTLKSKTTIKKDLLDLINNIVILFEVCFTYFVTSFKIT